MKDFTKYLQCQSARRRRGVQSVCSASTHADRDFPAVPISTQLYIVSLFGSNINPNLDRVWEGFGSGVVGDRVRNNIDHINPNP